MIPCLQKEVAFFAVPSLALLFLTTQAVAAFSFSTFDVTLTDTSRSRDVTIRVFYPENFTGTANVILVSHGGNGSTTGHMALFHLGSEYVTSGFVSVHLNHLPSSSDLQHQLDRPADVSFILDELIAGNVTFPAAFLGSLDLSKFGHAGHSWGAYTANAVGGGQFAQSNLDDPRVVAISPFSPQGPGSYGAFDGGPSDNTWRAMTVPTCTFVGELEKNNNVGSPPISMEDWRLFPFMRYSTSADHYLSVLPGQDHSNISGNAPPEVRDFLSQNSRAFFEVYLKGDWNKVCDIGNLSFFPGTINSRKFDPVDGLPSGCFPVAGDTLTFSSHADADLREQSPNSNFGANSVLRLSGASGGSDQDAIIKFNVAGVEGSVTTATLRLYNENLQPGTVSAFHTATGWNENSVTWMTAPNVHELLDAVTNPLAGQYIEFDVSSIVTANGTFSFRLTHTEPTANQNLTSREGASNQPELVVTYTTGARVAAWRRIHFGTTANAGLAANDADFDFDSLPNLLEYGLKRLPDKGTQPDGPSAFPDVTVNRPEPALANRVVLEIDMPEAPPPDVVYEVLESEDLLSWTVIAQKIGAGAWSDLGSGAPILADAPTGGRTATAVGSSQTLDFYLGKRVFLALSVTEVP